MVDEIEPAQLEGVAPAHLVEARRVRLEAATSAHGSSATPQYRAEPKSGRARSSTTSSRIRSPSQPSTKAPQIDRQPGVGVRHQHRPAVDPVAQLAEGAGGAERPVPLDRQVHRGPVVRDEVLLHLPRGRGAR